MSYLLCAVGLMFLIMAVLYFSAEEVPFKQTYIDNPDDPEGGEA